jgi:Kef-type K+ transport system membrane component KefB
MTSTIQILVLLLGVVAAVAVLATRLEIPAAILLVLIGVVLALSPALTTQTLMRLTPRLPAGWAEQRKLLGFR